MTEEGVPKNPLMDVPQWLFILSSNEVADKGDARTLLWNAIKEKSECVSVCVSVCVCAC
jgi:hypothetical protein